MPFSVVSDLFSESYTNMELTKDHGFILNTKTAVVVNIQKWCQWYPPPASIFISLNEVEFQGILKIIVTF